MERGLINAPQVVKSPLSLPPEVEEDFYYTPPTETIEYPTLNSMGILGQKQEEEPAGFVEGVKSGIAGIGELSVGLGLMAAKAMDNEEAAAKFMPLLGRIEEYQQENAQGVPDLFHIQDFSDFIDWAAHSAGTMLPEMALTMLTAGAGYKVGKGAVKHFTDKYIERQIAKGVAPEIAKDQAMKAFLTRAGQKVVPSLGAAAGATPQHTGHTFATDVKTRGFNEASPSGAITAGFGKAIIESFGPEAMLAKRWLTDAASDATARAFKNDLAGILTQGAKNMMKASGQEGLEESLQSGIDMLHKKYAMKKPLEQQDLENLISSGLSGAIMGPVFGVPNTIMDVRRQVQEIKDTTPNVQEIIEDVKAEEKTPASELEKAELKKTLLDMDMYASLEQVQQEMDELDNYAAELRNQRTQMTQAQGSTEHQQMMNQIQTEEFAVAAKRAKLKENFEVLKKDGKKVDKKATERIQKAEDQAIEDMIVHGKYKSTYDRLNTQYRRSRGEARKQNKLVLDEFLQKVRSEIRNAPNQNEFEGVMLKEEKKNLAQQMGEFASEINLAATMQRGQINTELDKETDPNQIEKLQYMKRNLSERLAKINKNLAKTSENLAKADDISMWGVRQMWEELKNDSLDAIVKDIETTYAKKVEPTAPNVKNPEYIEGKQEEQEIRSMLREDRDALRENVRLVQEREIEERNADRIFEEMLIRDRNQKEQDRMVQDYYAKMEAQQGEKSSQSEALRRREEYVQENFPDELNYAAVPEEPASVEPTGPTFETDPVVQKERQDYKNALQRAKKEFNDDMKEKLSKAVQQMNKPTKHAATKTRRVNKHEALVDYHKAQMKIFNELLAEVDTVKDSVGMDYLKGRVVETLEKSLSDNVERIAKNLHKIKRAEADARAKAKAAAEREAAKPKNQQERVHRWVKDGIKQLRGVQKRIKVVDIKDNIGSWPKKIEEAYREDFGARGAFDESTGRVYIFADRCKDRRQAMKTLTHEAVCHLGLRTIMTPKELNEFLDIVWKSFKDTASFKTWLSKNSGLKKAEKLLVAEEYIAFIAGKMKIGETLAKADQNVLRRLRYFIKNILKKFKLQKLTTGDVQNVLTAATFNIAREQMHKSSTERLNSFRKMNRVLKDSTNTLDGYTKLFKGSDYVSDLKKSWSEYRTKLTDGGLIKGHDRFDRMSEMLTDNLQRAFVIIEGFKSSGKEVPNRANFYDKELGSSNRTSERIHKFIETMVKGKDGLIAILENASDPTWDTETSFQKLDTLAHALHAKERNALIRKRDPKNDAGSGLSDAKADEIIEYYTTHNPAMFAAADKLRQINEFRLDVLEENNLLPKEVLKSWRDTAHWYVPLKGEGSWETLMKEVVPNYQSSSIKTYHSGSWKGSELATGRTDLDQGGDIPSSPTVQSIIQTIDSIRMIETAEMGRSILNFANEVDTGHSVFKVEAKEHIGFYKTFDKTTGKVKIKRHSKAFQGKDEAERVITVIDKDGNHVRVLCEDPVLAAALKGANMTQAPAILKGIGKWTRLLGKLVTSLSAPFIAVNAPRDWSTAMMNLEQVIKDNDLSKGTRRNITKNLNQARKAIWKSLNGETTGTEWDMWAERFRDSGAYTSMFGLNDFESQAQDLKAALDDTTPTKNWYAIGKKRTKAMLNYIENVSSAVENMTRLAAFKEAYEQFYYKYQKEGHDPQTCHDLASAESMKVALELTVNFTKKGTASPIFGPLYLFMNASLQSNVRMMKTLLSSKETAAKLIGANIALTLLTNSLSCMLMGTDDDGVEYFDKIPEYVRTQNYIIPTGLDGSYVKFPTSYGFNLFNMVGNLAFDSMRGKGDLTAAGASMVSNVFNTFMPTGNIGEGPVALAPSLLQPIFRMYGNQSFTGMKIAPEPSPYRKGELPNSERYWKNTSKVLVSFCQAMNELTGGSRTESGWVDVSPEHVKFLWGSYTGGLGKVGTQAFDLAGDMYLGRDVQWRSVPILSRLVGEVGQSEQVGYYMKLQQKVDNAKAVLQMAKDEKDSAEIARVRKQYAKELSVAPAFKVAAKRMKRLYKLRKRLNKQLHDGDISVKEYYKKLDRQDKRRVSAMQRASSRAETVGLLPSKR